ncbi:iron-containing redox enzyme family protein [Streptomyces uncialis]|uniref:iron-containing redox enzyme family protein n=1 Tax=Streptomyces uncialis TaxID=1048205 RepID=UPI002E317017|nr:iron-containing redox enzyme family protein [Streptomyces uncialis]
MPVSTAETATADGTACRTLYRRAADPEGVPPGADWVARTRAELDGAAGWDGGSGPPDSGGAGLDGLRGLVGTWAEEERDRYRVLCDGSGETAGVLAARAALACAPFAAHDGAWLQWMSAAGNADGTAALRLLALYASDVGVGGARASRGDIYVASLRAAGLAQYAEPAARLALDGRIADRDFYLPALLLAMSRLPDEFRPEILGADLCLTAVGAVPPLVAAAPLLPPGGRSGPGPGRDPVRSEHRWNTVRACLSPRGDDNRRAVTGFVWAWQALRRWSGDLHGDLRCARDPAYGMAELLRARAREGAVYHDRFLLAGRPVSAWLEECRADPAGFLEVLAASTLVRPGRSRESRLVNGLVLQRGPMFRVFSPEDLTVIRRWIDSLPREPGAPPAGPARPRASYPVPQETPCHLPSRRTPGRRSPDSGGPSDLRSAYFLLQGRPRTPALRRYTLDYLRGWLARSRHGIDRDPRPLLPAAWPRKGLRPWLLDQHDRHDREQATDGAPLPSRGELIDATVQLAPLTLIDGAWLQGFTDYALASSEHGRFLFETYWDELGNGMPSLNHPLIYRQVLAEMGVTLPPTASREFARWPGFREESFALPVYWLSIGRYPRTCLPEVLGLNLAMELSGVGGGYRRAHTALKEHGFSTRFVDIHNTIDNVATGHAAWAADAVDAYMASALQTRGPQAQSADWQRVRAGFRSLDPPGGFRARRAGHRARRSPRGRARGWEEAEA